MNSKHALPLLILCLLTARLALADWGQWRGPNHNGTVPESPPLAESWPKAGPARLWTSEKLPSAGGGGWASVSLVEGKAYTYINWKYNVPIETRTLGGHTMRHLGWHGPKPPEELWKKIEAARLSDERAKLKGKEVRNWIKEWTKNNMDEKERKKFGRLAYDRINRGKNAFPYEEIEKLATVEKKKFETQAALEAWLDENKIDAEVRARVLKVVPKHRTEANDTVMCFDAKSGKTLWKFERPGRAHGHPASSTPCVVGGRLYVLGTLNTVYCLNADTGEEIWKTNAKANPGANHSSSIVVVGDLAICQAGQLCALNTADGKIAWVQPRVRSNHNSPAVWKKGDRTLLVCNTPSRVFCVDPKDGKILWHEGGGGDSTAAVVGDDMVVFTNNKKVGIAAYKMALEKAEQTWTVPFTDRGASPLIHDGHVYAIGGRGNGHAMCIELATGKVVWDEKIANTEYSSPIVADGKIIAVVGRALWLIEANPKKYNRLAAANPNVTACTSPAFLDGKLYLRTNDNVECFDLRAKAEQAQ